MRIVRILVPLALVLMSASCAGDGPAGGGGGELEGTTWILDAASVASLVAEAPANARITIRFADGEVSGSAACNMYGGTFEMSDTGDLAIDVGAMTEMACEEPVMALESAFVDALGGVGAYRVEDDGLVLEGEEISLSFDAERPLPLVGTAWRLDGVATGTGAVSSTLTGTEATATFDDEGRVSGNASCNRFGGAYSLDGRSLAIDEVASTAMACEPDVMEQESAFLQGLGRAATFEVEGTTLSLFDADGGFLLSFVAR